MPGTKGRSGRKPSLSVVDASDAAQAKQDAANGGRALALMEAPSHLDQIESKWFRYFVEMASDLHVLKATDEPTMVLIAKEWTLYLQLGDELDGEGYTIEQELGNGCVKTVKNPKSDIRRDSLKVCIEICKQYGFSPESRTKVPVQKQSKRNANRSKYT